MGGASNLEGIISFSCGIGTSFGEASSALNQAKERKHENCGFNIQFYSGQPIADVSVASNAPNYMEIMQFLKKADQSGEMERRLEQLTIEPRTGLYNKLGYEIRKLKLEQMGIADGYYILFDGNTMKLLNDQLGRSAVDDLLAQAGKAVLESTRSGIDRRELKIEPTNEKRSYNNRRQTQYSTLDIIAHRVNHDGGDEFLVFVPIKRNKANQQSMVELAQRINEKMMEYQRNIYSR